MCEIFSLVKIGLNEFTALHYYHYNDIRLILSVISMIFTKRVKLFAIEV